MKTDSANVPADKKYKGVFGFLRKLYDKALAWAEHWAHTRYALLALFLLAFSESSFFPIPPDILLIALAIAHPKRSFKFAFICSLGSVLGGVFGYLIGSWLTMPVMGLVKNMHWQLSFFKAGFWYETFDFLAIFVAGFTPIPYKIFTLSAGIFGINFPTFLVASVISRSLRFFLVGGLIFYFGAAIKKFIDKYFNKVTLLFAVLLIGGFLAFTFVGANPDIERIRTLTITHVEDNQRYADRFDPATTVIRVEVVGKRAKSEVVLDAASDMPGQNKPAYYFKQDDGQWTLDYADP